MSKPVTFLLEMPNELRFDLESRQPVEFNIGGHAVVQQPPLYEGSRIFTPSSQEQVIPTKDTRLDGNIKIKPIPSNYGLITWNGSVITVS